MTAGITPPFQPYRKPLAPRTFPYPSLPPRPLPSSYLMPSSSLPCHHVPLAYHQLPSPSPSATMPSPPPSSHRNPSLATTYTFSSHLLPPPSPFIPSLTPAIPLPRSHSPLNRTLPPPPLPPLLLRLCHYNLTTAAAFPSPTGESLWRRVKLSIYSLTPVDPQGRTPQLLSPYITCQCKCQSKWYTFADHYMSCKRFFSLSLSHFFLLF